MSNALSVNHASCFVSSDHKSITSVLRSFAATYNLKKKNAAQLDNDNHNNHNNNNNNNNKKKKKKKKMKMKMKKKKKKKKKNNKWT